MAGSQQEIIIPADLPLVQELGATLREWAQIWHKLYVVCADYLSFPHHPKISASFIMHTIDVFTLIPRLSSVMLVC